MKRGKKMEYAQVFNDIIGPKCVECLSIREHRKIDLSARQRCDEEWKNLKNEEKIPEKKTKT